MLTHIRFLVDDLAPDVAFYRDVLGLRQVVDVPGTYAEFDAGGARLAFYRADQMAGVVGDSVGTSNGNACVICVRVNSVDEEAARLAGLGILLLRPPQDQPLWYQRVAHLRDARGRLIELWAPLAKSPA